MGGGRTAGVAGLALLTVLGIAIAGCGPIAAWRSLSGIDKNDPDPQTAPFSGNLAESEAAPYPNLSSVPPPPTRATTAEERQQLTQSLIADRDAADAAGRIALPAPAAMAAKPAATAAAPSATASEAKAVQSGAPAPPATDAASAPGRTALNSAPSGNSVPSGRRTAGEPPEPGPQDSTLQMPQVRAVPEPETTRPAPPAPALAAVPRPAGATAAAAPLPAAVASMMPEPAPPVPVLAPVAPPPSGVRPDILGRPDLQGRPDAQRRPEAKRAPATTVATLDIPGTATAAGAESAGQNRAQIERVAALYRDNPGTVRVIGYAAGPPAGGTGGDPLASYHTALGRAQGVARALAEAGIPVAKIQAEAAPAAGARAAGRVEIQFTQ